MSYLQFNLIEASDFNTLAWGSASGGTYTTAANNVAYIHGIGFSRYGYGQSTSAYTQAAVASTVTAAQWTGVINGINSSLSLQGQSNIAPAGVTAGDTITYVAAIQTGIDTAWTQANAGAAGSRTNGTASSVTGGTNWGGNAERRQRFTYTCTWPNADAARYWWNAGGRLAITCSLVTGGTTRNSDWSTLAAAVGTIIIGYNTTTKSGGSGSTETIRTTAGTGGFWLGTSVGGSHPGTSTLQFRQYSANAPYTIDHIAVTTQFSGTTSNGGFPVMTVIVDWENDYTSTFQQTVTNAPTTVLTPQNPVASAFGTALVAPTITTSVADQ
jgi:hypothetical protein